MNPNATKTGQLSGKIIAETHAWNGFTTFEGVAIQQKTGLSQDFVLRKYNKY
jgi:hypothetical protein